jgi:hypothetical protein
MSSSSNVEYTRHTRTPGDMIRAAVPVQCYLGGTTDVKASRVPFEDVVQGLSDPLRRYLERLVGDRATADDLLQDTLL